MTAGRDFFPARRQPQVTRPAADAATFAESIAAAIAAAHATAVDEFDRSILAGATRDDEAVES